MVQNLNIAESNTFIFSESNTMRKLPISTGVPQKAWAIDRSIWLSKRKIVQRSVGHGGAIGRSVLQTPQKSFHVGYCLGVQYSF